MKVSMELQLNAQRAIHEAPVRLARQILDEMGLGLSRPLEMQQMDALYNTVEYHFGTCYFVPELRSGDLLQSPFFRLDMVDTPESYWAEYLEDRHHPVRSAKWTDEQELAVASDLIYSPIHTLSITLPNLRAQKSEQYVIFAMPDSPLKAAHLSDLKYSSRRAVRKVNNSNYDEVDVLHQVASDFGNDAVLNLGDTDCRTLTEAIEAAKVTTAIR
jgi:hypothetical protein